MNSTSWQSPAAYLYVLRLDGPSLAWEYLRRNTEYRAEWAQRHRTHSDPAARWDLEVFEDPNLDARLARPVWRLDYGQRVRMQAADAVGEPGGLHRFSLWDLPGAKRMVHDGRHILLTGYAGDDAVHLALGQDLEDGAPFDFVIGPATDIKKTWRSLDKQRQFATAQRMAVSAVSGRPGRLALLHKRALQAFDGSVAGASQRDIARHLFGDESVARKWNPDSDMRAQVRHLLRRARDLVDGEFRDLIAKPSLKREMNAS